MEDRIDFERFGEDVFTWLWLQFGFSMKRIPDRQRKPNNYSPVCILRSVVRSVNLNQILYRKVFNKLFETKLISLKLVSKSEQSWFDFIIEAIEFVSQKSEKKRKFDIFTKVIQSLAIPAEMVLYLESKELQTYMESIPGFWNKFFISRLSKEFEKNGGLKILHERCERMSNVDPYLNNFISKECVPYTADSLYEKYRNFVAKCKPSVLDLGSVENSTVSLAEKKYKNSLKCRWEFHPNFGFFPNQLMLAEEIFQNPKEYEISHGISSNIPPEEKKVNRPMNIKKVWVLCHEIESGSHVKYLRNRTEQDLKAQETPLKCLGSSVESEALDDKNTNSSVINCMGGTSISIPRKVNFDLPEKVDADFPSNRNDSEGSSPMCRSNKTETTESDNIFVQPRIESSTETQASEKVSIQLPSEKENRKVRKKTRLHANFSLEPIDENLSKKNSTNVESTANSDVFEKEIKVSPEYDCQMPKEKSAANVNLRSEKELIAKCGLESNEGVQSPTLNEAHIQERLKEQENSPGLYEDKSLIRDSSIPTKVKTFEKEVRMETQQDTVLDKNFRLLKEEESTEKANQSPAEAKSETKDGKPRTEDSHTPDETVQDKLPNNNVGVESEKKLPYEYLTVKYSEALSLATNLERLLPMLLGSKYNINIVKNRFAILQGVGKIRSFDRSKSIDRNGNDKSPHKCSPVTKIEVLNYNSKIAEWLDKKHTELESLLKQSATKDNMDFTVQIHRVVRTSDGIKECVTLNRTRSVSQTRSTGRTRSVSRTRSTGRTRSIGRTSEENNSLREICISEPKNMAPPSKVRRLSIEKKSLITGIAPKVEIPARYYPPENERIVDRFAEDVFALLCEYYQVPLDFFHKTDNEPNYYEPFDFLEEIVTTVLSCQITIRKLLYEYFHSVMESDSNFFKSPYQTSISLWMMIWSIAEMAIRLKFNIFSVVIHSLTVVMELILFLFSRGFKTCTESFAMCWKVFFAFKIVPNFEIMGGMMALYEYCKKYNKATTRLKLYIEKKRPPYSGEDFYFHFLQFYIDSVPKFCSSLDVTENYTHKDDTKETLLKVRAKKKKNARRRDK